TCRGVPVRRKTSLRVTETVACCPSAKPALSASMTPANTGAVWLNVPTATVVDFHVLGTSDVTVQRTSARSLLTDTDGWGGAGHVTCSTAGCGDGVPWTFTPTTATLTDGDPLPPKSATFMA